MPRTARPTPETLQLRVTSPPSASERTMRLAAVPLLPWPLAAGVGGAVAALIGWLLLVGVVGTAWVTALAIPLPDVLVLCSQLWLLAHGGAARIAGTSITLVPLGMTLAGAALAGAVGRFAGGQARLARPGLVQPAGRVRLVLQVAALVAAGYAGLAAVMALTVNGRDDLLAPAAGALVVAFTAACLGAARAFGLGLDDLRPRWLAATVRGGLAGAAALLAVGALVVALATLLGAGRVAGIEASLGLDGPGSFVWSVAALGYLPTMLGWALAWALGGGITVGAGSLVTLAGTRLGMLPAIPLLGALPPVGIAPEAMVAWLASGVLTGAVAGVVAARRLGPARRGLAGAGACVGVAVAAGLLTSALLLALARVSTGSLGGLRLVDLGPRLPELALIAPPLLVLSAGLAGFVWWTVGAVRTAAGRR